MTDRRLLWPGLVASTIAAADAVLYLALIQRQGGSAPVFPWVFSALVVISCAVFWASMNPRNRYSPVVLAIATGCLFILGVIGIFSIGFPLLIASMFCLMAAATGAEPKTSMNSWAKPTFIGLAIAGIGLTALYMVQMSGGGTTVRERICVASVPAQDRPHVGAAHHRSVPARCSTDSP